MKIIKPFLGSDPLTLSQEEFNNNDIKTEEFINNDVNDYKGKKAKKRKIETSSESEDYDEKDLVEDESDGSTKMKLAKPFLDSDPLTLSQEEFSSNNDVKTEQSFQESEEKIESEKFDFDFEINDDANDIKTELADEESEEIPPVLEVRTDIYKRKGSIMPLFPELEDYSFHCPYCPYSATSESNLTNHKEDAHQPSKVIEPSPPKEPSNVGYQLKEDITAQGLNPTIDQSTSDSNSNDDHNYCSELEGFHCNIQHTKAVHLNSKPFKCDQCGKSFVSKQGLQKHINGVHLNLKPFKCTECSSSFREKGGLTKHTNRVHLNLKPFECTECQSSFSQKNELTRHTNGVHLKLRPKCDHCGKSFFEKQKLQTHINAVHLNLKLFKCSTCDASFATNYYLKKHIENVHQKPEN